MELSDLNPKERNIIDSMRDDKKLGILIKQLIVNYYYEEEGEDTVKEFLDLMFQNLDDFSEANLRTE